MIEIKNSEWRRILHDELRAPYFAQLEAFVDDQYSTQEIYPPQESLFRAFELTPPSEVKVVIIGQDPYHGEGQANGLAFSVGDGVPYPPSLRNIFKEVHRDINILPPATGSLDRWANQGVLLLNSVLTVRAHAAASHKGQGWERFTDGVIARLTERYDGIVYMLWGGYAERKATEVDPSRNCILKSVHPSPLSAYRGFFGCAHFSQANSYLSSIGKKDIAW